MGPEIRPENPELTFAEIRSELARQPGAFDFFQAVRLLTLAQRDRQSVGGFVPPDQEVVRFVANPDLAFPASQIRSLDTAADPPRMQVNFFGLQGPNGVLPLVYSELVTERLRARDATLTEFFDIFNHRMLSLFYQAWEKHHFAVRYEREGSDPLSHCLEALTGIGTPGLTGRLEVDDDSILFYSGLMSLTPRSPLALEQLLSDYFGVKAQVEPFVGAWRKLEPQYQCQIGEATGYSEQLGWGAVAGDEIWDVQSRARVKLGPLTRKQYDGFLKGGAAHAALRSLLRFFAGDAIDFEVQLVLKREDVPKPSLDAAWGDGPRLGWVTWLKSGEGFDRDPADTILLFSSEGK